MGWSNSSGESGWIQFDPDATSWFNAVVSGGATVSAAQRASINNLITSLKIAGLWSLMDRIWLPQSENTTQAKIDLVTRSSHTVNGTVTHDPAGGYTGNGTNGWINSNLAANAGAQFTQNSGHVSAWINSSSKTTSAAPIIALAAATGNSGLNIYPLFTDSKAYLRLNDSVEPAGFASVNYSVNGFWVSNRTSSTARQGYLDADSSSMPFGSSTSGTPNVNNISYLTNNGGAAGAFSTAQIAAMTIGAGLTSGQVTLLEAILKSYLGATWTFYCFKPAAGDHNLYAMKSNDLTNWSGAATRVTPPSTRSVRDPNVIKIAGTYWLANTNPLSASEFSTVTQFAVSSSADGIEFVGVTTVDCSSVTGAGANARAWSPGWFIDDDGSVHVIVALSSDAVNFALYEVHPTNAAFTTWSSPVQITGTSLPSQIDACVISPANSPNGKYNIWYASQDASPERVEYMSSSSFLSGYTVTQSGNWAGWGTSLESPCLVKLPNGNWRIWLDAQGGGYFFSDSSDNWATWTTKTAITAPFTPQHGCIMRT